MCRYTCTCKAILCLAYESPEGSFKIRNSKFEIRNSISKTTNQEKAFKLRIVYSIISYRTNKKGKNPIKPFSLYEISSFIN